MNMTPKPLELALAGPVTLKAGDELGTFMLGSTTVVVLDEQAFQELKPREILEPQKVSMGQGLSQ